jgi:alpha-D-ribose 1-methylphosphonate 5-triphosphate synthase subunit PhnG
MVTKRGQKVDMTTTATSADPHARNANIEARRRAMALIARARLDELARPIAKGWPAHGARDLKPVESGLVMLRGRVGGDGQPFNLGEATVTRAVVELPTGERGFAHILGRDGERARLAAIADALWQRQDARAAVEATILAPVGQRLAADEAKARAETAATRVDFFTLVRGEDDA